MAALLLITPNTRYPQVWIPNPIYNFILRVPDTAGEPLIRLEIQQLPSLETLYFQPQRNWAFVGTRPRQRIPLGEVVFDPNNQVLRINFDPPVPLGSYLRVEVSPVRNPEWEGAYLLIRNEYTQRFFSETAVACVLRMLSMFISEQYLGLQHFRGGGGELAIGQYIGTGWLQFYHGANFL